MPGFVATATRARPRIPARRKRYRTALTLAQLSDRGRQTNNFDLLRLLAAGLVLFGHSFDLLRFPEPFPDLAGLSWGTLGVIIFFSISGFLVSRSWDRTPRPSVFLINRALRLIPALIVALLLSTLVLGPLLTVLPLGAYIGNLGTAGYVVNNATMHSDWHLPGVFLHNVYPTAVNGSLWTLPLEVKAYVMVVLAGAIGLAMRRRSVMIGIAVYAVLAAIDPIRSSLPGGDQFVALLTNMHLSRTTVSAAANGQSTIYAILLGSFTIGAALYWLRRWLPVNWPLAGLALTLCGLSAVVGGTMPETAIMILGPYLVLSVAYRSHSFVRLPRRFGDYSYGIYLYAFPVQQTLSQLISPSSGWLMFVLASPIAFAAGVLSWHYVEKPALALKRRVRAAQPGARSGTPAELRDPLPGEALRVLLP
jgi:peptidoglycan/LPS O-acetylase OafA/YrhL